MPVTNIVNVVLALALIVTAILTRKVVRELQATTHELNVTKDQLALTKDQRDMYRRHSTAARGALSYIEESADSLYGYARDKNKGSDVMANAQTRAFETARNQRLRALRELLERDTGPIERLIPE